MSRILVVGASGNVGSEIVRLLKEQGHSVKTTTSKPSRSADQVHVDLLTGQGIHEAFEGVDRAFFLSPGGYADQYKTLSPLIQEAKRRGLEKVVLMTAMGADANEASPMRRAELELEKSGLAYNIIRPNWFMQNFNTFWVQGIHQQGKILLPAKKAKVSFIDTRDISAVAAKLLTTGQFDNRAFNLTGPTAIDHDEVAQWISKSTGKKIVYQEITPADLRKGLLGAGLREDYTDFLLLIFGYLAEGYNATTTDSVKSIIGRDPISFAQYAQDYKKSWL
jgi:uncharacterized protein YbjT (DUF2867 family)